MSMGTDSLLAASNWMVDGAGVLLAVGPVLLAVAFAVTAFVAFAVGRLCRVGSGAVKR